MVSTSTNITYPTPPSPLPFTSLPPALTLFCNLLSLSLALSLGVLPFPATVLGSAASASPLPKPGISALALPTIATLARPGILAVPPAAEYLLPERCSAFCSRYSFAAGLSAMGAGEAGMSAPFWRSSSATAKGFARGGGGGPVPLGERPGEGRGETVWAGRAGSAAASAR